MNPRMRITNFAEWAQPSLELDTLYLVAQEPMAVYLAQIWEMDTLTQAKPVIHMIGPDEMKRIKKRINGKISKESK